MIIGLDVGGTHTDVVLLNSQGVVHTVKVSTDPKNLFQTILSGIKSVISTTDSRHIQRLVLSTTLTTNAIVQQQHTPVGMIVMGGPGIDPEHFRTHEDYCVVSGAMDHRGREVEPVQDRQINAILKKFKSKGIGQIGVVGKFSVRNPEHEMAVFKHAKSQFEKIFLGHQISGNLNFPRRIATTFLNALVYPIHKNFFQAVRDGLSRIGLNVPIYIMKADGGTMNFESSIDFPGQSILSGPAASVMGSVAFCPPHAEALVFDIGGTTTDMAVLIDQAPLLDPLGIRVGAYKTLIRSLKTHSIGIGGDSWVRLNGRQIIIGPERKGPAMAHGGAHPTPTDALAVLNQLKSGDRLRARQGIAPLAAALGKTVEETAAAIFDQTCQTMLQEAHNFIQRINRKPVYTVHELKEGHQVDPRTILIIGGPAPHFARRIDALSRFQVGVVPHWQVANAIGAALARTTTEISIFADTEQGMLTAPEERLTRKIDKTFTSDDAVAMAFDLLKQKARQTGATDPDLVMEIVEKQQFNMVRGFYSTGKNIRVKAQIKPGLIHGYDDIADQLSG